MTPLPHSSQENAALADLVATAALENKRSVARWEHDGRLKQLYRSCSAMDAILDGLDDDKMRPSLQASRSIIIQLPVLLLFSFPDVVLFELRRFLEITFWNVYFHEHPVEWRKFSSNTVSGYSRDLEQPIAFCAHRELGFFVNYARERLGSEPSGLGVEAVDELQRAIRELNARVHAAALARTHRREIKFRVCSAAETKAASEQAERIFSAAAIVLCAVHRVRFNRFGPAVRAYFDRLVGTKDAKRIRSGSFGLAE
ncbi:MAG TPA: hypothetical protein VNW30_09090 [Opitutaceae bacterium]|jgi:hypothetical protein|nr:hypothetical protein [Opitutaceae bacterium]